MARHPQLAEIERIIRKHNLSVRDIASQVGISHTAINYWLDTPEAKPRDMGIVTKVLAIVQEAEEKLSTPATNIVKESKRSIYNDVLDVNQRQLVVAANTPVEIRTLVVNPNGPWSVNQVGTQLKIGSAFPGTTGLPIEIEDSLGHIKEGSVIIFAVTNYPKPNTYLLFESKSDADKKVIGWIDPSLGGSVIQTKSGQLDLSAWKVTHVATSVMWGVGIDLDDFRYSKTGLGPSSKPQE